MEEIAETLNGKQIYVVSHDEHEERRTVITTVVVMTEVFGSDGDRGKDVMCAKPARSDISRFFADLSAKIGRAMEGGRGDEGTCSR